jgi:hypothetical protein
MSLVLLAGGSNPGLAEAVAGPLGLPLADREASRFSDRVPEFDERIDYVFARGFGQRNREVLGQVTRPGIRPSDRVAGPLGKIWVSDHAGLVVTLLLLPHGWRH